MNPCLSPTLHLSCCTLFEGIAEEIVVSVVDVFLLEFGVLTLSLIFYFDFGLV